MPLISKINHGSKGTTYLWWIKEDPHYFMDRLKSSGLDLSITDGWHLRRQKEWLAGRHLIDIFINDPIIKMNISKSGKPHFAKSKNYFSISHSGEIVALTTSPQKVGIDIQLESSKIEKIAPKFVTDQDVNALPNAWSQIKNYHIIWSCKEAMFKAYGKGKVDFKKDLSINTKSDSKALIGIHIVNGVKTSYTIQAKKIGRMYFVIAWEDEIICD